MLRSHFLQLEGYLNQRKRNLSLTIFATPAERLWNFLFPRFGYLKAVLLRDELVSGLQSDAIRVRLLQLVDSEASLENFISHAISIEVPAGFFRSFYASSDTPLSASIASIGNIAVVNKRTAHFYKDSNTKDGFVVCGNIHEINCPARRSRCLKYGKQGHWAAACTSTVATVASDNDEQVAFVFCSVKTTNGVKTSPNRIYEKKFFWQRVKECSFPVRFHVFDPGSNIRLKRLMCVSSCNYQSNQWNQNLVLRTENNFLFSEFVVLLWAWILRVSHLIL